MDQEQKRIVLAYSGGLDTSVMLHWLKNSEGYQVIAFCADLGQDEELMGLEERALETGADAFVLSDLQEEFARDFVFQAIRMQAIYEGRYLLGTALSRPLIAKKQMEIAKEFQAHKVAHGATGKGNDQVRLELSFYALDPRIAVIAPWRNWPFKGRSDLLRYADDHKIPIKTPKDKPYSKDRNLVHISYEGGILEDCSIEAPEDIFTLTQDFTTWPREPEYVEIDFEAGMATALNGTSLTPAQMIKSLNNIGGRHGIGRIDIVENRFLGIKSRGVYESPGVSILYCAHRDLESICLDHGCISLMDSLNHRTSELIYNGFWFSHEFACLRTLFGHLQRPVNGRVRMKLYQGHCMAVSRDAPSSAYSQKLASFDDGADFDQTDASGFIRLNALRFIPSHPGGSK